MKTGNTKVLLSIMIIIMGFLFCLEVFTVFGGKDPEKTKNISRKSKMVKMKKETSYISFDSLKNELFKPENSVKDFDNYYGHIRENSLSGVRKVERLQEHTGKVNNRSVFHKKYSEILLENKDSKIVKAGEISVSDSIIDWQCMNHCIPFALKECIPYAFFPPLYADCAAAAWAMCYDMCTLSKP